MRTRLREWMLATAGVSFTVGLMVFAVAMWHERQKHALSGVPSNHWATRYDGVPVYVTRGGPSLEERTRTPISEEQFAAWSEYGDSGRAWGLASSCCIAAGVLLILVRAAIGKPVDPLDPD
jgi:hypothetical protein